MEPLRILAKDTPEIFVSCSRALPVMCDVGRRDPLISTGTSAHARVARQNTGFSASLYVLHAPGGRICSEEMRNMSRRCPEPLESSWQGATEMLGRCRGDHVHLPRLLLVPLLPSCIACHGTAAVAGGRRPALTRDPTLLTLSRERLHGGIVLRQGNGGIKSCRVLASVKSTVIEHTSLPEPVLGQGDGGIESCRTSTSVGDLVAEYMSLRLRRHRMTDGGSAAGSPRLRQVHAADILALKRSVPKRFVPQLSVLRGRFISVAGFGCRAVVLFLYTLHDAQCKV